MIFQTTATYSFAPPLNKRGGQVRRDGKTTDWWMILRCSPEIGRYVRHLCAVHSHYITQLSEPLWGTHVSVIRDEEPTDPTLWKSLEGESVPLRYSNEVAIYGTYAVIPVECPEALSYREPLGLPRDPAYPLHMTIGNLK